jgi:hypothetical protein
VVVVAAELRLLAVARQAAREPPGRLEPLMLREPLVLRERPALQARPALPVQVPEHGQLRRARTNKPKDTRGCA